MPRTAAPARKPKPTSVARHPTRRPAVHSFQEARVPLCESARKVDAEKGIIFDVKVLGHKSENGRTYRPEAMKAAIPLYEGVFVNLDHPKQPGDSRGVREKTAWLEGVHYVEGDGLRAERLCFLLPLDQTQKRVMWAAEHKPDAFGLSHNVQAEGETDKAGLFDVVRIVEVRSVDLVSDPATNKSLFESREKTVKKIKIRQYLTEKALTHLVAWKQKRLKKLLEDDGADAAIAPDMEMDYADDGAADMSADDHLTAGVRAACISCIDDDSMDLAAKLAKIKELLTAHDKLTGSDEEEDDADADATEDDADAADTEEDCDPKKMKESLRRIKREARARDMLEAAGVPLYAADAKGQRVKDEVLWESLLSAADEKAMDRIIAREQGRQPKGAGAGNGRPRSSAPGNGVPVTESTNGAPKTAAETVAFLRGGR